MFQTGRRSRPASALAQAGLVLAVMFAPGLLSADPVAVIAAVKGRVEVTPSRGPAQRGTFGRPLERGDRVSVANGGSATLFFNDGNVVELVERATMRIGGRVTGRPARAPELPSDVYASVSKYVAGGSLKEGLYPLPELRGGPTEPILIAPRGAILAERPTFAWRAVAGATRYRVKVSSAERGELWTREVEGLSLPYPSEAAPLAVPSECLWDIEAFSDTKLLRSGTGTFNLIASEWAAAVRANLRRIDESAGGPEDPAARFLAGSYLVGLGFIMDAGEQFRALCKLAPSSPIPHEALGNIYTSMGLPDLAADEFKQALALSREP